VTTNAAEALDNAIVCYMLDPRFVAQSKWMSGYGLACQFIHALESHGPEGTVTLVKHEEPDWQWWEPRYDQPFRRVQARERHYGCDPH
jgi:hypothetical protein